MAVQIWDGYPQPLTGGVWWQNADSQNSSLIPVDVTSIEPFQLVETSIAWDIYHSPKVDDVTVAYTWPAYVQPSFSEDLYNRLWFLPDPVDFGYILSTTERTFYVWNAYFVDKYCNSIIYSDDTQFTVEGLSAPFSVPGLGLLEYTAIATTEGAFQFNVEGTWAFVGEDITGNFIGQRVQVLNYVPLEKTMMERLEWLSDVIVSKNGTEQRIQVRQQPRQFLTYETYLPTQAQQSDFEAIMFQWLKKAFGVPLWNEPETHMGVISTGETTITVDTTTSYLIPGGLAIIWKNTNDYEVVRIESKTDSSITIETPMINTFTGKKLIIPMVVAWAKEKPSWNSTPKGWGIVKMSFANVDYQEIEEEYTPEDTFNSLPLLVVPSVVRKQQLKSADGEMIMMDYSTGKFLMYSNTTYAKQKQDVRFRKETKEACWNLRLLYHYLKGKIKTMYIPTYQDDFTLVAPIADVDNNFLVTSPEIAKQYIAPTIRHGIIFHYTDGTYITKNVTAMEVEGNNSRIHIESALGVTSSSANCRLSWLDKVRLASDDVEFDWELAGCLESKSQFIQVED